MAKKKPSPKGKKPVRKMKSVSSSAKLVMWGEKANVVGTYKGTLMGWSYEDGGYFYLNGTIGHCVIAQEGMEMTLAANGFSYECNLSRLSGAINGFSGNYECGGDTGSIRGRIIPDLNGWLFIGEIVIEQKYKFYAELW